LYSEFMRRPICGDVEFESRPALLPPPPAREAGPCVAPKSGEFAAFESAFDEPNSDEPAIVFAFLFPPLNDEPNRVPPAPPTVPA
jgi:hypothetical protein